MDEKLSRWLIDSGIRRGEGSRVAERFRSFERFAPRPELCSERVETERNVRGRYALDLASTVASGSRREACSNDGIARRRGEPSPRRIPEVDQPLEIAFVHRRVGSVCYLKGLISSVSRVYSIG